MPEHHDKPLHSNWERPMMGPGHQYFVELTRIVTFLFVGVLALMTFLLTVGFQRPHADFSYAMYTAIIVLALNLVAYAVGHMFFMNVMANRPTLEAESAVVDDKVKEDKDDSSDVVKSSSTSSKSKFEAAKARLRVMRVIQQVLFLVAVLAVAWLALATAHFFFTIPAASSAATTGQ
jgi:hypothetical protein